MVLNNEMIMKEEDVFLYGDVQVKMVINGMMKDIIIGNLKMVNGSKEWVDELIEVKMNGDYYVK